MNNVNKKNTKQQRKKKKIRRGKSIRNNLRKMTVYYCNIRGIKSKINSLEEIMQERKPTIMILTETWLDPTEKIDIERYKVYRNDRDSKGGGILIAVKKEIGNITDEITSTKGNMESTWISINNGKVKMKIGGVYIPKENIKINELKTAYKQIESEVNIGKNNGYKVMIVGDLNCKVNEEDGGVVSRGGKIMMEMARKEELSIMNEEQVCQGKWTRIEAGKKSVLDYVLTQTEYQQNITKMVIDEKKEWTPYRVKKENGTARLIYTDHTAIWVEANLYIEHEDQQKKEIKRIYGNRENKSYMEELKTKEITKILEQKNGNFQERYEKWSESVKTVYEAAGREINNKKSTSKEQRTLVKHYKTLRKRTRQRIRDKGERKKLTEEIKELKEEIIKAEKTSYTRRIRRIVENIKREGGNINPGAFWEVQKQLTKKKEDKSIAIKNKRGERVEGKEEVLCVYKEFYKDLLEPTKCTEAENEGKKQEEWIDNEFEKIRTEARNQEPMEISEEDVRKSIKKLKKKKAGDRDGWRNEMIIEGGEEMVKSLCKIFKEIARTGETPERWEKIKIRSIHKKGSTTEMNNRRGIFLTNIVSKVWERIIMEEIRKDLKMSVFQNGAQKGKGTIDNMMTIMAVQNNNKRLKQNTYMVYADAYKCFDKLWLRDCLVDLRTCGVREKEIMAIYQTNRRASIQIQCPAGVTDEIEVNEIVKQGTVLGPLLCCVSTQKINEVGPANVTILSPEVSTQALTYVDDIAGVGSKESVERVIESIAEMEKKKKFTFSEKKSKVMVIKNGKQEGEKIEGKIKNGELGQCQEYKYLGTWITEKGTFDRQLEEIESKAEGVMNSMERLGDKTGEMGLRVKLFLYEKVGMGTVFHGVEIWSGLRVKDKDGLERVHTGILKRILKVPKTTPTWGMYCETGFWPIKWVILYKQLMMLHGIVNGRERLAKTVVEDQKRYEQEGTWYGEVERDAKEVQIEISRATERTKSEWKREVKKRIKTEVGKIAEEKIKERKKLRFMKRHEGKKYLTEIEGEQAEMIVRVRLNMVRASNNMGRKEICRLCEKELETTEHLGECREGGEWKVTKEEIESEDKEVLKKVARRFIAIERKLKEKEEGVEEEVKEL